MLEIGSKVKVLNRSDLITGTVAEFKDFFNTSGFRVVRIKIENSIYKYDIGCLYAFYEKDLEVIKPTIDSTSPYHYCSKCDVLTSNKNNLCCDHLDKI